MASRILAQVLVMGSGVVLRAFAQAYRQALVNATKSGAAQEAVGNTVRRASKALTEKEARQILGVPNTAAWDEILKKYDVLFERNAKQGSFYLQSKVHRAKECLEGLYQTKA
ncbi:mitochondrial import inner membrane translocase subunit PAM16 like 2-like [Silene latifolia]|uniref:mitochondrial import inner membrane translocase subunit PAM16 like 2-like n=1 Tax=Silene latifolia TaxID=37657 RepID=UPI003D772322